MTKLLEKQIAEIRRTATKYKHTHTALVEAFNKELEKQFFKPLDAQEFEDPEKLPAIYVKNLGSIVNKLSNTKS